MQDEIVYKLMKLLEAEPALSQREIAKRMGISLGKANYCIKSLIEKGYVKARNFYRAKNKKPYIYQLTPSGLEEKVRVTHRFLKHKMAEYEAIKKEIEGLKSEIQSTSDKTSNCCRIENQTTPHFNSRGLSN